MTSLFYRTILSSNFKMNSEVVQIKCKGCKSLFPINFIRKHLYHNFLCKEEYSEEESQLLEQQYQSYCKKRRAENYQKKKKKQKEVNFISNLFGIESLINGLTSYAIKYQKNICTLIV